MDNIALNICAAIDSEPRDLGAYSDLMAFLAESPEHDGLLAARQRITRAIKGGWADARGLELLGGWLRDALTLDGRFDLDAFMQAMEFDRDPESRLWLPRRSRLMRLCRELQWFETAPDAEFLSVSMPPRTAKSSTVSMASIWHMGRDPKPQNLVTAHSDALTQHFYEQLLEFATDRRYRFHEIFPDSPIVWQSAEYESFSLKERNSYPTCTCRSVGGTLTGAVEVGEGGWLVADDLIKELEEALSPRRLQVKWEKFVNQCYDRRKKGSKVLMIGTRWAVEDPIGRMLELHEGEAGFHELTIPALDPKTGESNFDYLYGVGFDRHYYLDMMRTTDKATYAAKYDGKPVVREGQLFNPDDLERYLTLPSGEPSQVVAVVDTKGTGVDYEAMPVLAQWDGNPRWYLVDCICDNGKPDSVNVRVAQCVERNGVQRVQFESNNGGDEYAKQVGRMLAEAGHLCAVQTKRTSSNKETRILAAQPWIQEHVVFPDSSRYGQGTDMDRFMGQLFGYVLDGKNPHDDAPDSLSMLANMLARRTKAKATAVRRPF